MCVRVCAFCALVFISSFFIRFALWCISKKNFETGTRGKSTKLRIKFTTSARTYQCRKYSTAKNTTTMSTSTGTLSFFFARTCDRNWDYAVASARKTRRDEKIFFGSAYSLFCCCLRSRDDLKISNAKEEFMLCSHHHCGTRKKAKRKKEREKFQFFEAFVLRVVARVSRRMREYRFLFNVSV